MYGSLFTFNPIKLYTTVTNVAAGRCTLHSLRANMTNYYTHPHRRARFWVICSTPPNGDAVEGKVPSAPICCAWSSIREANSDWCRRPHCTYSLCTVRRQAACFKYSEDDGMYVVIKRYTTK